MLKDAFREIRWGTDPTEIISAKLPSHKYGKPVAELLACSYTATKSGKVETFRHEFDTQYDSEEGRRRGPYLLEVSREETMYLLPSPEKNTVSLGYLIDLELVDGTVVFTPFYYVCSTSAVLSREGGEVLLASELQGPRYAIEHRNGRPFIKAHGIIG